MENISQCFLKKRNIILERNRVDTNCKIQLKGNKVFFLGFKCGCLFIPFDP